jgi:[protein-PII] uridylyltransferase
MGYPTSDVDAICNLIQHHLLLSEIATRRDLDDPATISKVADAVGSADQLALLAALTEADSLATGSSAWGPWKAELVSRLVERVLHVMEGGQLGQLVGDQFPTAEQLARLAGRGRHIDVEGTTLTVMTDDRPGIFSRVAGVLALHGLDVVTAAAISTDGRALSQFSVEDRFRTEIPWARVRADLELALSGRLALNARLAERRHTYRSRRAQPEVRSTPTVKIDNGASADATVIDVFAPDRVGVLYRITRALAELDLDIRSAKVETMGANVLDAFYVRSSSGGKLTDPEMLAELERAITHAVAE